jgi:tetraacyldisaccharide 4'-kinase
LTGNSGWPSRPRLLGAAYGRITRMRRAWYARKPDRRRRLNHPVISVGNLALGGSGKTPVVAAIAHLLRDHGERPAILTRGYGRRHPVDGVLVVSDGQRVLEPVERSGDEPQLLARTISGVPVLVSPDRYLAGVFAEKHFGTTVSILDDGYQHLQLHRDIDLLLISPIDLIDRVMPSGRLREPLDAARFADALLVTGSDEGVSVVVKELGGEPAFRIVPHFGELTDVPGSGSARNGDRVLAFAAIARPERFFDALRSLGYNVVKEITFPDHHYYSSRDVAVIVKAAKEVGASLVVTTQKDTVRVVGPFAVLPMTVEIEPAAVFEAWLLNRLTAARSSR